MESSQIFKQFSCVSKIFLFCYNIFLVAVAEAMVVLLVVVVVGGGGGGVSLFCCLLLAGKGVGQLVDRWSIDDG